MWMPISTMTCWQTDQWQASCTTWTRHLSIGTPRSKLRLRLPCTAVSLLVSARLAEDQIVDLCQTLRYFRVPICEKSYLFGDNEVVINSSTRPHSKLHKRHNALSFHQASRWCSCLPLCQLHISGWRVQSCRYSEQTLGISASMEDP